MPFADYKNFKQCVSQNQDKDDPEAYCAEIKRKVEKMSDTDWTYDMTFEKVGDKGGHLYLAGYASNGNEDEDAQNMDMESLKTVYKTYMENPVVKLLHDKAPQWKGAVGVVVEKFVDSAGKTWETSFGTKPFLVVRISKSPKLEWLRGMIDEGMFKGFSIGGKAKSITDTGTIIVKSWLETSIVDVPSAKGSFFQVLKSACTGDDCPYNKGTIPLAPVDQEINRYVPTVEDRKRTSWYNLESVFEFMGRFPDAKVTDICERFGFELDYCNELLEKIETITKAANANYFSKGEISAEDKKKEREEKLKAEKEEQGKETEKKQNPAVQKFIDTIDKFNGGNMSNNENSVNDFCETAEDFLKGGPGSGVKGHKTIAERRAKDKADINKFAALMAKRGIDRSELIALLSD